MTAVLRDRRPRGPILDYNPSASTRQLLGHIAEILEENRDYWPLTVRAVYYRLLGRGDYPKSKGLASRVSEHVSNARRAGLIEWRAISDQNETRRGPVPWEGDADEYADLLRRSAANVEIDQQEGQPVRILVWTEAAGMVPMLANAVGDRYGVDVISTSGYDSTTVRHNIGVEIARDSVPWVILHIGDHDPDGRAIFRAMAEDVEAWADAGGGRSRSSGWPSRPSRSPACACPMTRPSPAVSRPRPSRPPRWSSCWSRPSRIGATTRPSRTCSTDRPSCAASV